MKFLCYFGIHFWRTIKEKHKVINHPSQREYIRIIVRECEICGKRQHNVKRSDKRFGLSWKNCTFDKDSIINIKEIKQD